MQATYYMGIMKVERNFFVFFTYAYEMMHQYYIIGAIPLRTHARLFYSEPIPSKLTGGDKPSVNFSLYAGPVARFTYFIGR